VKPVNRKDPKRAFFEIRETIEPVPAPGKLRYFYNEVMDDRMSTFSSRRGPLDQTEFMALLANVQRDLDGEPIYRIEELEMPWDDL
jgi:hypothetical protein